MFEFKLTPAYCLYNGIAILEQHGAEIIFMMENLADVVLQGRIKRAFDDYLENVLNKENCPEYYNRDAQVEFVQGSREQIRRCVSDLFKATDTGNEQNEKKEIEGRQKEAAAILLLDSILQEARERRASDIHIEGALVRFRISGELETVMEVQSERCNELIQRIKLLAGMNIIEKKRCQDGRFVYGKNNPIFVRVSEVVVIGPESEGIESLVLRLLDTTRIPLNLDLLGFNENQLMKLAELEVMKNGLVLVCGPTGSGKSTTIASILVEMEMKFNSRLKIITMEDPPEYIIPGVSQIQIDDKTNNSYDEVLTHIFRQDPDVIMIGEIRDEHSAATAIRAALTGHLVFATLHTGGAGEAVLRMENLGVERRMLVSVLRAVVSQELSFMDKKPCLCADVAFPKTRLSSTIKNSMTEEEIDERFDHCTNYSEVLSNALSVFKKEERKLDEIKIDKKIQRFTWRRGVNGKNVHKKIS